MKKILFVCHGNICCSVAAEFIFNNLVRKQNLNHLYYCESRATSREEIGNDIYPPMKQTLIKYNINIERHHAKQIDENDYRNFDLIFLMDQENLWGIKQIIPQDDLKKIHLLSEYVGLSGDIEDPWYTGRYDLVYKRLKICIERLIEQINNDTEIK